MFSAGTGTAWEPASSVPLRDAMVVTGEVGNVREVFRALLKRSGLSLHEVARRLGVSPGNAHDYGKNRTYVETLAAYAAVCGGRVIVELPEKR